jgi:hypothetical protein
MRGADGMTRSAVPHGSRTRRSPPSRAAAYPRSSRLRATAATSSGSGRTTRPLQHPRIIHGSSSRARCPRVHAEVVVVPARRHEERAGVSPHHLVEAESLVVEPLRLAEVAHVQVDVAHARARRHARPRLTARSRDDVVHVEGIRRHEQLPLPVPPLVARPVGVHLDAVAVGVMQVQRLAHEVVRRAGCHARVGEVRCEPSQRRAVRQQQREVVEAMLPARRDRRRAGLLPQLHQHVRRAVLVPRAVLAVPAVCAEGGNGAGPLQRPAGPAPARSTPATVPGQRPAAPPDPASFRPEGGCRAGRCRTPGPR